VIVAINKLDVSVNGVERLRLATSNRTYTYTYTYINTNAHTRTQFIQVIVAINKLDVSVDGVEWSQARYEQIKGELLPFLRATGFKPSNMQFVPVR
jgi:translation elongation factor EF-1alpha